MSVTFRQRDCIMCVLFLKICFLDTFNFCSFFLPCLRSFLTFFNNTCICFWKCYIAAFCKQIYLTYRIFLIYPRYKKLWCFIKLVYMFYSNQWTLFYFCVSLGLNGSYKSGFQIHCTQFRFFLGLFGQYVLICTIL